jgi:hypothetical protein
MGRNSWCREADVGRMSVLRPRRDELAVAALLLPLFVLQGDWQP